ncbi:hypothetical protein GTA08_BOTSDO03990 [Neofusicoccum parvum]|nr:hypothetical protein GTA08_BOTSDO03990 [Neofusicoccum parvum]
MPPATPTPSPLTLAHWRCCLCHTTNPLTRPSHLPATTAPLNPALCALCHNAPCAHCTLSAPPPHPASPRPHPARRGFLCRYCGAATLVAPARWRLDHAARALAGDPARPAPGGWGNGLVPFERRRGRACRVAELLVARCGAPACGRAISDECLGFDVPGEEEEETQGEGVVRAAAGWVGEVVGRGAAWDWGRFWRDRNMGWVAGAVFFGVCLAGSGGGAEGFVA